MGIKCPKCQFDNPDNIVFCGKCGTKFESSKEIPASPTKTLETPKEEFTRGTTFAGRYEIIEELGKGGMGKVYRVEDKKIKEEVALKLIKPEIASDKKTIGRFSNELKIARKIRHKNVCGMYDLDEKNGTYYITMEYVPGEDLKRLTRKVGQFSAGKTIFIAKQVCEGLAEAHRLGVVHRDLKPQNIMVDEDGNARIMDFGIARSVKGKGITAAGVMIGTPEYMSPEQAEIKEVDQRSDIYSLGVILYEMVTGRVPFEGETPLGIAMKHKSEMPPDPREINAQIPEDLSSVILRCMEKDREKRYQSAGEVRSELSSIEKGIPTSDRIFPTKRLKTEKIDIIKWKKAIVYGGAAVLIILIILAGIYLITGRQEAIDSIAVLPLENLSGDRDQEYFADGMTDALISNLAKIGSLTVISRTSVMRYKKTEKSLPEIARELKVDAVVEGTVLTYGQRLRITVQLIDARTDRHLWNKSYERDMRDVIALQNEVARAVAREIQVKLTPHEEELLAKIRQIKPEAYQAYLKGRFFREKRTGEDLKKAIECFEQAIEVDPNYAMSYAGVADSFLLLPQYSPFPPKEAYLKAKEAALKALEIDNTLAEAHASLAMIKVVSDLDWEGAEKEFKRAIELNPSYATAHHWYAFWLMWMERHDESVAEIKLAKELDPLSLIINANVGFMLFYARRYDEAIEQYQNSLEMYPNFDELHRYIGMAYEQKGMYKEAVKEFKEAISLSGDLWKHIAELGRTYAVMGKRREAMNVIDELKELSERKHVSMYNIAAIYTALDRKNQAFEWLEKAYKGSEDMRLYLKVDPWFDNLRSDPRYKALLQKMGLE